MKKGSVIALIVAVVLIFAGGILLMLGLSFAGDAEPVSRLTQQEILIQESFENIQIDTADCNVTFVPYNGTANAHVVIMERDATSHSVLVEDGTLKIQMTDNRTWKDHIGIHWESMEMTVYLPQSRYNTIWVSTETGDIRTPAPLSANEILLRSATGDIYCDSAAVENLDCMTATGRISVKDGTVSVINLQSSTGEIYLQDTAAAQIHLRSTSGDKILENVDCKNLTCESDTGDVELEGVVAQEYLQVFTDTGDVEIENCDAGSVNIETDTGDVEGNFLTPKRFQVHSETGHVRVPNTREGGECRIETDTGDIRFE